MRGIKLCSAALVIGLAVAACGSTDANSNDAEDQSSESEGDSGAHEFVGSYEEASSADLADAEALMRENQMVEYWTMMANELFVPPVDVPITAKECGVVNAWYDSETQSITMCYEFAQLLTNLFAEPDAAASEPPTPEELNTEVVGAYNGVFFHEFGHGLIDLYDLPVTGKEEDAVDQLSSLILIETAEETGDFSQFQAIIETWARLGQNEALDASTFSDEHSLSQQRYFNVLCYLVGSDPDEFGDLVDDGTLPEDRAMGCPAEYEQLSDSWGALLEPHLKD